MVTVPLDVMNPVRMENGVFVPVSTHPSRREPVFNVIPVMLPLTNTGDATDMFFAIFFLVFE